MYYFVDSKVYGMAVVSNDYSRSWIDDMNAQHTFYHHITKDADNEFYKYFTTDSCRVPVDYKPAKFVKLVHFKDSDSISMSVSSHFYKIQQYELSIQNKKYSK
jgi:hypothetical protein